MLTWTAKAPGDVARYTWTPPIRDGDAVASISSSVSGATIDEESIEGDEAVFYVSGGTAVTTAVFTLTAYTDEGETLTETVYLPIIATTSAFADTAQEIINFALRPITGLNDSAETVESTDALEWLNGMLASWKDNGADVGATLPLATGTVVYAPDSWLLAIKNNLRVLVAEQYGRQVAPMTLREARAGLQQIKWANLPNEREGASYF